MSVFLPDRAVIISDSIFEQLDDLDEGTPLLPPGDARLRAHCRLWSDHVRYLPLMGSSYLISYH